MAPQPPVRTPLEVALGDRFDRLPPALKAVHRSGFDRVFSGAARVDGADTLVGRLVARLFGFPAAGASIPVRVAMRLSGDGTEFWDREFGGRPLRSRLVPSRSGVISEWFGPFRFDLAVDAGDEGLSMRIVGWRLGSLPLPLALAPRSEAVERVDPEGRFAFDVPIDLPLIGRLVRYRGSLWPNHSID